MGSLNQPELQIWRETSTNNYRKVASSLVDTSRILVGPNLFEFIPQAQLQFQEGDMLGVYRNMNNEDSLVLYEQRETLLYQQQYLSNLMQSLTMIFH